jgi:phospholipid/cholesterol/gamma-HCH transport system substrate-binding protein
MSTAQRFRALKLLLFLLGCFAISSYYFSLAGTHILPGSERYRVQAVVPNAISLATAGDVREAGVNIGKVAKLGDRGDATILDLDIEKKYSPVYRDARVLVRAKSVAGENYVEIDRGTPAAGPLPSGGVLTINHADEATQIDELFSVFDQARRRDLQRALQGLGGGLQDGGANLNKSLESTANITVDGAPAANALATGNGRDVSGLVDAFGRVTAALGDRADAIQTLTRQAKATASAVATRDAKLRDTIAALPALLRTAQSTSTRLTSFSIAATPVVRDLRLATEQLVPTVRDLGPAARGGVTMVDELTRFARAVEPAVAKLTPFSRQGAAFVDPLAGFLRQGNPMFEFLAPYFREVATFFAEPAASFQASDATGHLARIILPVSRSNAAGALTAEQEALLQKLSGPLDTRGTNAYPKPGEAGDVNARTADPPRLQADPPYTR